MVIDKNTYSRLLKACNYKSKDDLELEKESQDRAKDDLLVFFQCVNLKSLRVCLKLDKYLVETIE